MNKPSIVNYYMTQSKDAVMHEGSGDDARQNSAYLNILPNNSSLIVLYTSNIKSTFARGISRVQAPPFVDQRYNVQPGDLSYPVVHISSIVLMVTCEVGVRKCCLHTSKAGNDYHNIM